MNVNYLPTVPNLLDRKNFVLMNGRIVHRGPTPYQHITQDEYNKRILRSRMEGQNFSGQQIQNFTRRIDAQRRLNEILKPKQKQKLDVNEDDFIRLSPDAQQQLNAALKKIRNNPSELSNETIKLQQNPEIKNAFDTIKIRREAKLRSLGLNVSVSDNIEEEILKKTLELYNNIEERSKVDNSALLQEQIMDRLAEIRNVTLNNPKFNELLNTIQNSQMGQADILEMLQEVNTNINVTDEKLDQMIGALETSVLESDDSQEESINDIKLMDAGGDVLLNTVIADISTKEQKINSVSGGDTIFVRLLSPQRQLIDGNIYEVIVNNIGDELFFEVNGIQRKVSSRGHFEIVLFSQSTSEFKVNFNDIVFINNNADRDIGWYQEKLDSINQNNASDVMGVATPIR